MRFWFIQLVFLLTTFTVFAQEMPIVAYMGVPARETSLKRYEELKNCGFNTSISIFPSTEEMFEALDVAEKAGVKLIPHCPSVFSNLRECVPRMKNHPAFLSYMVGDEPKYEKIEDFGKLIDRLRNVDKNFPCYVNLAPWYSQETLEWLGCDNYKKYVRRAANRFDLNNLSFDFYPIVHIRFSTRVRSKWYTNLQVLRTESQRTGRPFWAFVLSTPHAVYPQPTLASLRLQVYVNLAYGAKGIQYFTYWTQKKEGNYDYHNGPIDLQGNRTETYSLVRQMNDELKTIAPLFYHGSITRVGHIGDIPEGANSFGKFPSAFKGIRYSTSDDGLLVATMNSGGKDYLLVVNKSLSKSVKIEGLSAKKIKRVNRQLKEEDLHPSYSVQPGDMLLLRYS